MKFKLKNLLYLLIILLVFGFNNVCFAFENDIKGSTGWAAVDLLLRSNPSNSYNTITTIKQGNAFLILGESGNYLEVSYNGMTGYVDSNYCMINMPDVTPSIIYNIVNASSSTYRSSGYEISGVTGTKLYNMGKVMNYKIGREEYICPTLYSTAKMIDSAQQAALNDGYSLKIYDIYRPRSVSTLIYQKLSNLYYNNSTVQYNIDYSRGLDGTIYYWGQSWFLAQSVSSHNTGSSVDLTLVDLSTNEEVVMPTPMNELSTGAIKYYSGSVAKVPRNYSVGMLNNIHAQKLDNYMTGVGMTTLSSEWWHFQDQTGYERIKSATYSNGCDFQPTEILSVPDEKEPEIIKHKLTYNTGNHNFVYEYEYGELVILKSDLNKIGYNLKGWYLDGKLYSLNEVIVMPDRDLELTASWDLIIPEIKNYNVDGSYLKNIPLNTDVNNIDLGIDYIYDFKFYNHNNILKTSGLIGTGDKVKIYLNNDLVSEYEVIVKGDVNGDGNLSVSDIIRICKYIRAKNPSFFDECYVKAADTNVDGSISVSDIVKINNVIRGKQSF